MAEAAARRTYLRHSDVAAAAPEWPALPQELHDAAFHIADAGVASAEDLGRPWHQRALLAGALCLIPGAVPNVLAAADRMNATRQTVVRSRDLLQHGHPKIIAKVWDGSVRITSGARFAEMNMDEQVDAIQRLDQGYQLRALLPGDPDAVSKSGKRHARNRHNDPQLQVIETIMDQLRVLTDYGLKPIHSLDVSIKSTDAERLNDSLTRSLTTLHLFQKLLKGRMTK